MAVSANNVIYLVERADSALQSRAGLRTDDLLTTVKKEMPWATITDVVRPGCIASWKNENRFPVAWMLRIYVGQKTLDVDSEQMEFMLHENSVVRHFVGARAYGYELPTARVIAEFANMLHHNGLVERIENLIQWCLRNAPSETETGAFQLHGHASLGESEAEKHLAHLVAYFDSLKPPYGVKDILGFNTIYKSIYFRLGSLEKLCAEEYVDKLIEGLKNADDAEKIFGVV